MRAWQVTRKREGDRPSAARWHEIEVTVYGWKPDRVDRLPAPRSPWRRWCAIQGTTLSLRALVTQAVPTAGHAACNKVIFDRGFWMGWLWVAPQHGILFVVPARKHGSDR